MTEDTSKEYPIRGHRTNSGSLYGKRVIGEHISASDNFRYEFSPIISWCLRLGVVGLARSRTRKNVRLRVIWYEKPGNTLLQANGLSTGIRVPQ